MAQTQEEMMHITTALLGPYATLTFSHGLFSKHKEILGCAAFLSKVGDLETIFDVLQRQRELLNPLAALLPENKDRAEYTAVAHKALGTLHQLAINAAQCERRLKAVGMKYDLASKKIVFHGPDTNSRPPQLYSAMVREVVEHLVHEKKLALADSEEMRKAVADCLRPIFAEPLLSTDFKSLLSRTIGNAVNAIRKIARERRSKT